MLTPLPMWAHLEPMGRPHERDQEAEAYLRAEYHRDASPPHWMLTRFDHPEPTGANNTGSTDRRFLMWLTRGRRPAETAPLAGES